MIANFGLAELVFITTVLATFVAAIIARRHRASDKGDDLAGRQLNRWLVGLSAGTTANSGFIVTAAVGLGYSFGMQWILLPISWLFGDLVFWYFFPARINDFGRKTHSTTLSELLISGLPGAASSAVAILCAVIILVCLTGYTSAQWLAGQKFMSGAFGMPDIVALCIFAATIIAYSMIGGFRGSIYTDTLQAFIRIFGTIVALGAVIWVASAEPTTFWQNIAAAGSDFLNPFPGGTVATVAGFVFGFAAAAIGFGLGQPQIISRYLAGSSPEETRAAWPIYVGFVQFTWVSMTLFGMLLRGVSPSIADPEAGLSIFFQQHMPAIATGIIAADIFATIASTSNGLLIAMAQAVTHDILPRLSQKGFARIPQSAITVGIGLITMLVSWMIHGTVVSLALSSVSLMGAGLAGAVIIKIMNWHHSAASLLCGISAGIGSAIVWKYSGLGASVNEAGIGILVALTTNWLVWKLFLASRLKESANSS